MRLKQLVLQGYKTFATKTEFVFDEGITAIVGPNGSGKSNIADAVRWVLGEQSYSTLRGKRTIDMIFAGSQSRPRAGMAQAILTLDNSDGWLPIDYTEVEIGRRAYRSGENEYILNGQRVRLRDITELLASSGLAERTYTIIGQGLVDQALSLRSDERRALFEEAAGISHYKSKRAETIRRLQETQGNLIRIHDILAEIKPRLTSLKRQATRARNYEQIALDLRHLLRIWYGFKWEQVKDETRRARETADLTESQWQQSRKALLSKQQKIDSQRQLITQYQQNISDLITKREDLRAQWEKARREAAIIKERQQSTHQQLADIDQETPILVQQQAAARADLSKATADLTTAQSKLDKSQDKLQQFNANFQSQQVEINNWQATLNQSEQKYRLAQTQLAQSEGQLSQLQERLDEKKDGEQNSAVDELKQVELAVNKFTAVVETAQSDHEKIRPNRDKIEQERLTLIKELKQFRRKHKEKQQLLVLERGQLARLEARAEMLGRLQRKKLPISEEIQLIGRFAALINIPKNYRTALEAALASRLETLIVADSDQLWQLLKAGDTNQAIMAFALENIQSTHPPTSSPAAKQIAIDMADPAILGWADDLVKFDDRISALARLLLSPILLVRDAETAYRIAGDLPAGMLAVTPDGFVAHAGGLVEKGGLDIDNSILARETALKEARTAGQKQKAKVEEIETAVAKQETLIHTKQSRVDYLLQEEQQIGRWEREASQRVNQAQRKLDRAQQQRTYLDRQQQIQAEEIARLTNRIAQIEQTIGERGEAVVTLNTAVNQARAQLENLPIAEARQQRQSLQQSIQSTQTIVAGRQAVVDSRHATLNQVDKQIARLQERQISLQQHLQQLSLNEQEANVNKLQESLDEIESKFMPLRTELQKKQVELAGFEGDIAAIQKQTHERETLYTQTQIALSQQQNKMEGLQERIKSDLGIVALSYDQDQTGPTPLPIGEVVEELPQVTELPDDIEDTIQRYRGQMQRIGAINPDAPEEFEEAQDRFDFLTTQVEDLNQTEGQLRQVIAELDDLTSRAFAETVEQVNAVFGDIFTNLFGGGSARLILTNPDDLTISGVDIIARLPNRREQGLALLSGGERSLTAAALIFSLLKVAPTPFCILDEVDAALDEANINRFRELLRELSRKTQFIVITHNRGTVQVAHTMYGISMGSDSASQSISIKPEEYVKQANLV